MNEKILRKPFNKRAFISSALFASGFLLPISGLMNHLLQFEGLNTARHFWMSVHDVSGIIFIILAILHISFNWKAMMNYIKKAKEAFISKETLLAITIVIIIVGLFSSHVLHINN